MIWVAEEKGLGVPQYPHFENQRVGCGNELDICKTKPYSFPPLYTPHDTRWEEERRGLGQMGQKSWGCAVVQVTPTTSGSLPGPLPRRPDSMRHVFYSSFVELRIRNTLTAPEK